MIEYQDISTCLSEGRGLSIVVVEAGSEAHLEEILYDRNRKGFEVKGTSWQEKQNERRL